MYNQSLVASLIDNLGEANTEKWAKSVVNNLPENHKEMIDLKL